MIATLALLVVLFVATWGSARAWAQEIEGARATFMFTADYQEEASNGSGNNYWNKKCHMTFVETKVLKANPAMNVWFVGHTDSVGTLEASMKFSEACGCHQEAWSPSSHTHEF